MVNVGHVIKEEYVKDISAEELNPSLYARRLGNHLTSDASLTASPSVSPLYLFHSQTCFQPEFSDFPDDIDIRGQSTVFYVVIHIVARNALKRMSGFDLSS